MEENSEKLDVVTQWLKETFQGGVVPPFEVNHTTVDVLYDLAIRNRTRNAEAEVEITILKEAAQEYKAEGMFPHLPSPFLRSLDFHI